MKKANVIRINNNGFRIMCPYCHSPHQHGGVPIDGSTKVSHCQTHISAPYILSMDETMIYNQYSKKELNPKTMRKCKTDRPNYCGYCDYNYTDSYFPHHIRTSSHQQNKMFFCRLTRAHLPLRGASTFIILLYSNAVATS